MGTRVTIGSYTYEVINFSVSESSSPLAAGDTSGAVGDINFSFPVPLDPTHPVAMYGAGWLIDQPITLSDSRLGYTLGSVTNADPGMGSINVTGSSRLAQLNIYNVQAQPYIGTLDGAFAYYLSLAGITTSLSVDPAVASRTVTLRGFTGELWLYLKQLAMAQECDLSLVSGVILLRPLRTRIAEKGRFITDAPKSGAGGQLAQTVEVYWYQSTAITDQLVYPPGGWTSDVEVLNVNAGETATYQLDLSASVSAIQTPVMGTAVASDYSASSVYTIVADDGFPVPVAQWNANGGLLTVTINPDTVTLTVTLVGATNIGTATGTNSKAFSVALASDTTGSRYSTLRIVGTGVQYIRDKKVFRTGVGPSKTANAVGATVDNIFLTDLNSLYHAGSRLALQYSGMVPSISGSVTAINKRGDSGSAAYPTYGTVQAALTTTLGAGFTYAAAQTYYVTTSGFSNYAAVDAYWLSTVQSDFTNQAFGNVNGARIKDPITRRWYRIRNGTITPGNISFDADDDLTMEDVRASVTGQTYAQVQTKRNSLTYQQDRMVGLIG